MPGLANSLSQRRSQSCRIAWHRVAQGLGEHLQPVEDFPDQAAAQRCRPGAEIRAKSGLLVTRAAPSIPPALPHGMKEQSKGGGLRLLGQRRLCNKEEPGHACSRHLYTSLGGGGHLPGASFLAQGGAGLGAPPIPTHTPGLTYTRLSSFGHADTHLYTQVDAKAHRMQ